MLKHLKYIIISSWILLISFAYYSLFPFREIIPGLPHISSISITGNFLSHLLILALFIIAASGWGIFFWYKHHLFYVEKIVFSCAFGLGLFSLMFLLADFAGIAGNIFYFFVLIAGFILFLTAANRIHEHFISGVKAWMLILLIPIVSSLIGALAPPTQYDSLVYHLALPKEYLFNSSIFRVPYNFYFSFPQNMEMLYQAALSLDSDILANLFHWIFLALTSLLIYTFSKRYLDKKTGVLAALIWYFTPIVLFLSTGTYVDLGVTFFVFMSFYNILLFHESKHKVWLYSAGLFSGIALGIKYTAIIPIALFLPIIIYESEDIPSGIINILKYSLITLLVFSPWLVKNLVFLKNPIAPWGGYLFTNSVISNDMSIRYLKHIKDHGLAVNNIFSLILTPWKVTAYGFNFGGGFDILGPVFLLFLPLFIFRKKFLKVEIIVLFFTICYCLIWLMTGKVLRFLVPALPFICILTAVGLANISYNKWLRTCIYLFFITALVHNIFLYHWVMNTIDPYSVVIGQETREAYLTRKINSFKAINEVINYLPENAMVLNWGETRSYYLLCKNITPTDFDRHPLVEWLKNSKTENDLAAAFKAQAITHVMINEFEVKRLGYENRLSEKDKLLFEGFKEHFTKTVYEDKYCRVYKLIS